MLDFLEARRMALGEAEIFYRSGGSGPPLLLLHGYPQTHLMWHRVAPALAEEFTLVVPDLRGYGASRGPGPDPEHHNYCKRAMAEDMAQLMSKLGHARFLLAGHDRGARVGYRLCLDHPERVVRFAALDIIPTGSVWREMDADRALSAYHWQFLAVPAPVPERLIGNDPEFFVTHILRRWVGRFEDLDPRAVAAYVEQFRRAEVLTATCEDYRAGASVDRAHDEADLQQARKLPCPLLVLWSRGYLSDKTASPLAAWRQWADDVHEVALECGHFIAEEQPEACLAALRAFFHEAR